MKKLYTLIITSSFLLNYSVAQPTINAVDFNPVIGQSINAHTFTPTSLMPGATGAGATWNFASTPNQSTLSFTYVTPASTPFGASFPTANTASNQNGAYEYLIANTNYLARAGVYGGGVTIPYSNEQKFITYPFTFNNTFTDNFAATFTSGGYTYNRTGSITVTADGYGTLVLPWGSLSNVLRLHFTETYQDVSAFGTQSYSSDNYAWIKPGTHYYLYTLSELTTAFGTNLSGSYIDQSSVGLNTIDGVEVAFNMYPNPAADQLSVSFNLDASALTQISIFNPLGEKVYAGEENTLHGPVSTTLDIATLPAGLYMLYMRMNDKLLVKKLMVD